MLQYIDDCSLFLLLGFIFLKIFIPPCNIFWPCSLKLSVEFFELNQKLILFVSLLQFYWFTSFDISEHFIYSVLINHLFWFFNCSKIMLKFTSTTHLIWFEGPNFHFSLTFWHWNFIEFWGNFEFRNYSFLQTLEKLFA